MIARGTSPRRAPWGFTPSIVAKPGRPSPMCGRACWHRPDFPILLGAGQEFLVRSRFRPLSLVDIHRPNICVRMHLGGWITADGGRTEVVVDFAKLGRSVERKGYIGWQRKIDRARVVLEIVIAAGSD